MYWASLTFLDAFLGWMLVLSSSYVRRFGRLGRPVPARGVVPGLEELESLKRARFCALAEPERFRR